MCHERLAFSGKNPQNFRSPRYQIQVSLSGFVSQDTGFPVLEGRVSETWSPGNCGRPCRGTQVSRFLRDLCSATRRASNEAGYLSEHTLLYLPSVRSPRLGTHASRSSGDICSKTRTPGNFSGPRRGTQASLSSRNKYSETRIRELELYIGP